MRHALSDRRVAPELIMLAIGPALARLHRQAAGRHARALAPGAGDSADPATPARASSREEVDAGPAAWRGRVRPRTEGGLPAGPACGVVPLAGPEGFDAGVSGLLLSWGRA